MRIVGLLLLLLAGHSTAAQFHEELFRPAHYAKNGYSSIEVHWWEGEKKTMISRFELQISSDSTRDTVVVHRDLSPKGKYLEKRGTTYHHAVLFGQNLYLQPFYFVDGVSESHPKFTISEAFTWKNDTVLVSSEREYRFDEKGYLVRESNPKAKASRCYQNVFRENRLTAVTVYAPCGSESRDPLQLLEYRYDEKGRVILKRVVDSGRSMKQHLSYDKDGRLSHIRSGEKRWVYHYQ